MENLTLIYWGIPTFSKKEIRKMSYKKFMKRAAETQVADLSGIVGQLRVAVESDASIRNSNVSISYGVAFESLDNNVQAELGTAMEALAVPFPDLSA